MNTLFGIPLANIHSVAFGDTNLHEVVAGSLVIDGAGIVKFDSTSISQSIAVPIASIDYVLFT